MAAWQIWLIVAGICLVIEIATVGFLIFWLAIAALITCILSLFIHSFIAQFAIFVILSAVLIFLTRPFAKKINKNDNVSTNINRLIGKKATVTKEISENHLGQVKVGSDVWAATSSENISEGTTVTVEKVDGVKLIVSK